MIDGRRRRKRAEATADTPVTTRSIGERLVALGVGANMVTAFGVLLAAATGVLIGLGDFLVAVGLIIVGGLMDTLDGHVAKAAGTASGRGAFFDSVSDRVGDSMIFLGLAWYFVRAHDANTALLPIGILALANLVSYERAKAESLGYRAQGGLMERAERLILLGVTLTVGNFVHAALVPLLALLAVLTGATAVGRFVPRLASSERNRSDTDLADTRAHRATAPGVVARSARRSPAPEPPRAHPVVGSAADGLFHVARGWRKTTRACETAPIGACLHAAHRHRSLTRRCRRNSRRPSGARVRSSPMASTG